MSSHVSVDGFAAALDAILADYSLQVSDNVGKAVRKSIQTVRKEAKEGSPKCHEDGYQSGWATSTKSSKNGIHAECGNKLKPGLVHLLEKGHNTLNGARVAGRPHLEPAAEEGFKELEELLKEL